MTTIVLTHGAFHGSWCFEPLVAELEARGATTALVDLPLTDLTEDAAAVTAVLDAIEGPILLLGHSYGGAVVTVAGNHPSVERLVYLAALGPDAGELGSGGPMTIGEQFLTTMRVDDDGLPFIDPEFAAQIFYPDIDPTEAARLGDQTSFGKYRRHRHCRKSSVAFDAEHLCRVHRRSDSSCRRSACRRRTHGCRCR